MKQLLLPCFILLGVAGYSQNIAANADKLVSAYTAGKKFSGNILIAKKDSILFQKSYGFASLDKKQLNNPGTSFRDRRSYDKPGKSRTVY